MDEQSQKRNNPRNSQVSPAATRPRYPPPCHAPLTSPIHKSANPPPSPLLSSSLPFPSFHFPCKTQPEWLLSRKENHITVRAAYVGRHPTRGRRGASRLPIPEFLFFFSPPTLSSKHFVFIPFFTCLTNTLKPRSKEKEVRERTKEKKKKKKTIIITKKRENVTSQ